MRGSFLVLVLVLAGCGGAPGAGGSGAAVTPSSAPSVAGAPAASDGSAAPATSAQPTEAAAPSEAGAAVLPADCAEGLGDYLKAIQPAVSGFDPASSTLGALLDADMATKEIAIDLLQANDSRAPYSCSEVGLEWAYFDSGSPWEAVLAVAATSAPGTVNYLTGLRALASHDVEPMITYGVSDCDTAVKTIKDAVADHVSADTERIVDMPYQEGIALLGLYEAYMHEVQNEVCPRDELGNDEWDFMRGAG